MAPTVGRRRVVGWPGSGVEPGSGMGGGTSPGEDRPVSCCCRGSAGMRQFFKYFPTDVNQIAAGERSDIVYLLAPTPTALAPNPWILADFALSCTDS